MNPFSFNFWLVAKNMGPEESKGFKFMSGIRTSVFLLLNCLLIPNQAALAVDEAVESAEPQSLVESVDWLNQLESMQIRVAGLETLEERIVALENKPDVVQKFVTPSVVIRHESRFFAGYDNVVVKPYFSKNLAYWNLAPTPAEFTSFDWDATYTPRIFIGYEGESGTGVRARYWQFDSSTSFARAEQAGEGLFIESNLVDYDASIDVSGTLHGEHSIDLQVIDFEVTHRAEFRQGWLFGGGGFRYANLNQRALWSETGGPEFIRLNMEFEGVGPTIFFEGGVALFDSDVSLFANARGSLLYGNRSGFVGDDAGSDRLGNSDSLMPVFEGQIGFDWETGLCEGRFHIRVAAEAQEWFAGGAASGGDDEGTTADELDLGFFGISIAAIFEL